MASKKGDRQVVFQPAGRSVPADEDATLLELATLAGVDLEAPCGGKGSCGNCRVQLQGATLPPDADELATLGPLAAQGFRLACRATAPQGGRVWVPEESRRHQQVVLSSGERAEVPLDSEVQARGLCRDDGPMLGLAVDLGTTTVVAYLLDLRTGRQLAVESAMNPQVVHGDDVVSRLAYCVATPQQQEKLTRLARSCVDILARRACQRVGCGPERIFHCVLVGNTAMHHIFLELDVTGLSRAPFRPQTCASQERRALDLGLALAPAALVSTLPLKAGFVGADAVAAALALAADRVGEATLIADLGTNGELILATPEALLCCSTAMGPAFEGGHISGGMRAAPGAVDHVRIPGPDLEPQLSVIGDRKPIGLCGSGLVSAAHALLRHGAIGPTGQFTQTLGAGRMRAGSGGPEYVLARAAHSGSGRDLVLTRRDVAELQLAKAAIHAGVTLMLEELGLRSLSRVLLAGAFGNYLDPADACGIGLFPGVTAQRVRSVGNAAGAGAITALLNREQAHRAEQLAANMRYLELASAPRFRSAFAAGLAFPRSGTGEPSW